MVAAQTLDTIKHDIYRIFLIVFWCGLNHLRRTKRPQNIAKYEIYSLSSYLRRPGVRDPVGWLLEREEEKKKVGKVGKEEKSVLKCLQETLSNAVHYQGILVTPPFPYIERHNVRWK